MKISLENLKKLREETGISIIECKKALEKAEGDIEKAKEILKEKGKELIKDKLSRGAFEGLISAYVHPGGKIGVLLECHCQTDFVARSEEFKKLCHEICLQIAALGAKYIRQEDIPQEILEKEREIYKKQLKESNKPAEVLEKIIEGKLEKFKKEISLLSQPWIKDEKKTISDLIENAITKFGEKIEIVRFVRFSI